jgi:hypothetical protein
MEVIVTTAVESSKIVVRKFSWQREGVLMFMPDERRNRQTRSRGIAVGNFRC